MTEPDANGWYPIESAPREGRIVFLWVEKNSLGSRGMTQGRPEGEYFRTNIALLKRERFTHWRPTLKPPVEFEEKSDA